MLFAAVKNRERRCWDHLSTPLHLRPKDSDFQDSPTPRLELNKGAKERHIHDSMLSLSRHGHYCMQDSGQLTKNTDALPGRNTS